MSFLVDLIPIITVLSMCFTFFVGELLKPENYDALRSSYLQKIEDYNEEVAEPFSQYESGEISPEEYNEITAPIEASYFHTDETDEEVLAYLQYTGYTVLYYFIGFNLIYFIYIGITQGRTFGRRFTKIELKGKINWWTLFLREFIWKTFYWSVTFGVGILVDVFMISFTRNKLAFRDMVAPIKVEYE